MPKSLAQRGSAPQEEVFEYFMKRKVGEVTRLNILKLKGFK